MKSQKEKTVAFKFLHEQRNSFIGIVMEWNQQLNIGIASGQLDFESIVNWISDHLMVKGDKLSMRYKPFAGLPAWAWKESLF